MYEWVKLAKRWGPTIKNPTPEQLRQALEELHVFDDEHPDCWIECGSDDGLLYTLSFFASGLGIYDKYADVDMQEQLETKKVSAPTIEDALLLWEHLINGRVEEI